MGICSFGECCIPAVKWASVQWYVQQHYVYVQMCQKCIVLVGIPTALGFRSQRMCIGFFTNTQELAGDDAVELAVEGVETVVQTGPFKGVLQNSSYALSSR